MRKKKIDIKGIMNKASKRRILIPAFNVPYLPLIKPIVDALERCNTFALIQVSRPDVEKLKAKSLEAVLKEYQRIVDNKEMIGLHLDHIPVIDEDGLQVSWKKLIQKAIDLGFDSVMIDGSRLSLEENIVITTEVVSMAHPYNIPVEAALGMVFAQGEGSVSSYEELFRTKKGFTGIEDAKTFVKNTEVDWLSISCGNIHGAISGPEKNKTKVVARLDIKHIAQLKEATNHIPLVLHGGSGIKKESLLAAIRNGITKLNVNTEIRQVYERGLAEGGNILTAQEKVTEKIEELIVGVYEIKNSFEILLT